MAEIVTLSDLKKHLNISDDADDLIIQQKIASAMAYVARATGVDFDEAGDDVPEDLREGVRLLAAHFYENREASVVGLSAGALPYGLDEIIQSHRVGWF